MAKQKTPPVNPEKNPGGDSPNKPKVPKQRSPNYPSIDLKAAIGKLPKLFEAMKRHAVGVEVAVNYMDLSYGSSTGRLALAAMRSFGLFQDERSGKDSMVKLSTRALDIVTDYPRESQEWMAAVKQAALSPNIHANLWAKYGASLPPDDELRRYLVRELKFNDNSVATFIQEYKDTIAFAKLSDGDIISSNGKVAIGSLIQWTASGVDQFPEPRRVESISEDGEWLWVENSGTGIPMSEATVVESPPPKAPPRPPAGGPPPNPNYKPPVFDGPRIEFPLPNGNSIEIRLKKRVAKKDFDKIKQLVDLSEDSLVETGDAS